MRRRLRGPGIDAHRAGPRHIWEPAAGKGAIVQVLRAAGHGVVASDLVDYGLPLRFVGDFLTQTTAPICCDTILANPPFKIADRFIAHALDLCPRVIVLARLALLESRPAAPRSSSTAGLRASTCFASGSNDASRRLGWAGRRRARCRRWFVWERGHTGPIVVDRIPRLAIAAGLSKGKEADLGSRSGRGSQQGPGGGIEARRL